LQGFLYCPQDTSLLPHPLGAVSDGTKDDALEVKGVREVSHVSAFGQAQDQVIVWCCDKRLVVSAYFLEDSPPYHQGTMEEAIFPEQQGLDFGVVERDFDLCASSFAEKEGLRPDEPYLGVGIQESHLLLKALRG